MHFVYVCGNQILIKHLSYTAPLFHSVYCSIIGKRSARTEGGKEAEDSLTIRKKTRDYSTWMQMMYRTKNQKWLPTFSSQLIPAIRLECSCHWWEVIKSRIGNWCVGTNSMQTTRNVPPQVKNIHPPGPSIRCPVFYPLSVYPDCFKAGDRTTGLSHALPDNWLCTASASTPNWFTSRPLSGSN